MDEVEQLIDELRDSDGEGCSGLLGEAADKLESQSELLKALGEFVAQYRDEFEESLSYEQQEQYREYFGLDHAPRGLFGHDED